MAIRTWSIPYALSGTNNLYKMIGHDYETACRGMCSGRMLYAWTAGKCADLRPGKGLLLMIAHVRALAQWLEGLEGMTFKVLLDFDLEPRTIKFSSSTRKRNIKVSGNDQGISNVPYVMIRREPSQAASMSQITKPTAAPSYPAEKTKDLLLDSAGLPPAYSPSTSSTRGTPQDNDTTNDAHRPTPLPPATTKWPMVAIYDFKPVS